MRIGIIGLGDIAKKAYLPILATKGNIELVLCTRNKEVLNQLASEYRINETVSNVDDLIKLKVDAALVCTHATAHFDIAKKLIENGINVYIDKPISFDFNESKELSELARLYNITAMVGFNRRFVPMFRKLKEYGKANIIIMQKNREYPPGDVRRFIVEDFIHVVDTLRYLMDEDIEALDINYKKTGNDLMNVVVTFKGKSTTAIGVMNRTAGITEEIIEYMVDGNKYIVEDLVETYTVNNNGKMKQGYDGWKTSLYKRGFVDMLDNFINSIEEKQSPEITIEDSIKSHEICERIVSEICK